MRTRNKLGQFLNKLNLINEGAEVGVFRGNNAANLLKTWNGKKLYLIDPWSSGKPRFYHSIVTERFKNDNRVKILKLDSQEASKRFKINSLDWIHIDGDHSYPEVKLDLSLWYLIIKSGGLISGHDYNNPKYPGVKKAVDEFATNNNIVINTTRDRTNTWWFIK